MEQAGQMTVADALQQSRDAHDRYRQALPHRVSDGAGGTIVVQGDAVIAGEALSEAAKWRAEAHVLDTAQGDPAWTDEAATHDHSALLDFYVAQLTREPEAVKEATAKLPQPVDPPTVVVDPKVVA